MFGLFKRKKASSPSSNELQQKIELATDELRAKWAAFHQQLQFNADVPLS